jgi:hypothetical protein
VGLTINAGDLEVPSLQQFAMQAAGDFGLELRGMSEKTLHLQPKDVDSLTTIKILRSNSKFEAVILTPEASHGDLVALWRLLEAYSRILDLAGKDANVDIMAQ